MRESNGSEERKRIIRNGLSLSDDYKRRERNGIFEDDNTIYVHLSNEDGRISVGACSHYPFMYGEKLDAIINRGNEGYRAVSSTLLSMDDESKSYADSIHQDFIDRLVENNDGEIEYKIVEDSVRLKRELDEKTKLLKDISEMSAKLITRLNKNF